MKAKKPKVGRPKKKDKMKAYVFTALESVQVEKIKKVGKPVIDEQLRKTLNDI